MQNNFDELRQKIDREIAIACREIRHINNEAEKRIFDELSTLKDNVETLIEKLESLQKERQVEDV